MSIFTRRPTRCIRVADAHVWLVSFKDYDLEYFEKEQGQVEPGPDPFAPEKVYLCLRYKA
jgi:hypothetical protein